MIHVNPPEIRGNMKILNQNVLADPYVDEEEDQCIALPFSYVKYLQHINRSYDDNILAKMYNLSQIVGNQIR